MYVRTISGVGKSSGNGTHTGLAMRVHVCGRSIVSFLRFPFLFNECQEFASQADKYDSDMALSRCVFFFFSEMRHSTRFTSILDIFLYNHCLIAVGTTPIACNDRAAASSS